MRLKLSTRYIMSWIATCAILMMTLAPAISNALAAQTPVSWAEICTTSAATADIAGSPQDGNTQGKNSWHFNHCNFCLTHAGTFALPADLVIRLPLNSSSYHFPVLFYQSSSPLFVWSAAQPRAPPVSS